MRTISKLSVIVLIVFFLFFSVSCSDEEETDIIGAHTVPVLNLPFQAAAVSFDDIDFDEDQINGSLLITKATDETLVDEYRVYWGSSATEKLSGQEAIATFSADGTDPSHSFSADSSVPAGATHFLVYSATETDVEAPPTALDIPDACYKLVKDIRVGSNGSLIGDSMVMNNILYFAAEGTSGHKELWKSDGIESGTEKLKTLSTTFKNPPRVFTVDGNTLYFTGHDDASVTELWKTDGTAAGTVQLTDFNLDVPWPSFGELTAMNGEIFFPMDGDGSGRELWKNSGSTPTNQTQVSHIEGSNEPAIPSNPSSAVSNNKLFFAAGDVTNNVELWSTDGGSPVLVKDIDDSGGISSSPKHLTAMNGLLYFSCDANSASGSSELWKSDGTTVGTTVVKVIHPTTSGTIDSNSKFLAAGNTLYFVAMDDSAHGFELWRSDGTNAETKMVKDITPGIGSGTVGRMTEFSGKVFFKAGATANDSQLWETDGTEAGTNLVKSISTGISGSAPAGLTVFGDHLYFFAADAVGNKELWRSDGTENGTFAVTNFTGDINASDAWIQAAGDKLLFLATNAAVGQELFVFYYK